MFSKAQHQIFRFFSAGFLLGSTHGNFSASDTRVLRRLQSQETGGVMTQHQQSFSTARRAGCACGFVAESNKRENARRQLIRHIINPQAPGKIADSPADHQGCTVEKWSDKWGVCTEHSKYVDLEATSASTHQTSLPV